jgi:hypothetical protein
LAEYTVTDHWEGRCWLPERQLAQPVTILLGPGHPLRLPDMPPAIPQFDLNMPYVSARGIIITLVLTPVALPIIRMIEHILRASFSSSRIVPGPSGRNLLFGHLGFVRDAVKGEWHEKIVEEHGHVVRYKAILGVCVPFDRKEPSRTNIIVLVLILSAFCHPEDRPTIYCGPEGIEPYTIQLDDIPEAESNTLCIRKAARRGFVSPISADHNSTHPFRQVSCSLKVRSYRRGRFEFLTHI